MIAESEVWRAAVALVRRHGPEAARLSYRRCILCFYKSIDSRMPTRANAPSAIRPKMGSIGEEPGGGFGVPIPPSRRSSSTSTRGRSQELRLSLRCCYQWIGMVNPNENDGS